MYEFKLADVGEGIHEVEIARWLVSVGDVIKQDQVVVEIETDKALVEIPSPVAGKIAEIKIPAGSLAHVGDVLVVVQTEAPETTASPSAPVAKPVSKNGNAKKESPQAITSPGKAALAPDRRVLAAPAVRKLALTLGIDLAQVPGTGPSGRILPDDVHRFAEHQAAPVPVAPPVVKPAPKPAPAASPAPVPRPVPAPDRQGGEHSEQIPLRGLRRRIAQRMEQAWRVPHVTSFEDVDASQLLALHKRLRATAEQHDVRLTFLPLVVKIVAQLLGRHPYFNASLDMENDVILCHNYYHIGIATAIDEGLLVPVVRHADQLSVLQIAAEVNRLAEGARQRSLPPNDLTGSTFTITNFGSFGSQLGTPIINPPEVAILGIGRVTERPVAVDGELAIRPIMPLALSYDHRLIDGAAAGAFLADLTTLLEQPTNLLLELS